jgi:LAGLIDADG DNA endonuclease family
MDDEGRLDYNKNSKTKSVVFNTHNFKEEEVIKMSLDLKTKFNLSCEVRSNKNKKVIVIHSSHYSLFRELINPYIISEMLYKLP